MGKILLNSVLVDQWYIPIWLNVPINVTQKMYFLVEDMQENRFTLQLTCTKLLTSHTQSNTAVYLSISSDYLYNLWDFTPQLRIRKNAHMNRLAKIAVGFMTQTKKRKITTKNKISVIRSREAVLMRKLKLLSNLQLVTDHAVKSNECFWLHAICLLANYSNQQARKNQSQVRLHYTVCHG